MKKHKEVKISYFAAHLTTIVSVTLLLLIVGAIGLLGVAARNTAREVKELQQVSIVTADSISDEQASRLLDFVKDQSYALDPRLITKGEALADWNEQTGDDLLEIAGYNFLSPEITFRLKEQYTSKEAMSKIMAQYVSRPDVDEIVMPDSETSRGMDSFFSHAFVLLGVVAAVMILISCVLINNTVLLTIYSRRFGIYTMQLVGATPGFIRRPFIANNILSGIISATAASGVLLGVIAVLYDTEIPEFNSFLPAAGIWLVIGALYVIGVLVCGLSAGIATSRYLRRNYDDLFRS